MRAKPTTTYHLASPKTWELIRAAYLAGLSAPALSARFGVSVGAIRKRAGRDGWTKRAYAETLGDGGPGPFGAPAATEPAPAPPAPEEPDAWARLAAVLPPPRVAPAALARRSLNEAAQRLGEGRLDDARKLVAATQAIVRLSEAVDLSGDYNPDPYEVEARQSLLRRAMFELAIDLSERLRHGRPMPEAYADLHASWLKNREGEPS